MKFRGGFLRSYLERAPAALAFERTLECEILAQQAFARPILDIGCGDGIFASVLFAEPLDTGIDPDASELARARQTGAYSELIACGGDAVPKPDGAFRTILSNSVLEHIPDLDPVLREAHRLLAPGGRFFLTVPTDRLERNVAPARLLRTLRLAGLADRYGTFHNRYWRHFNAHSVEEWKQRFARCGFTVAAEQTYASPAFSSACDLLMPFAVPAAVSRRLKGRWFFLPEWRRRLAPALHRGLAPLFRRLRGGEGSSLVFFALARSSDPLP